MIHYFSRLSKCFLGGGAALVTLAACGSSASGDATPASPASSGHALVSIHGQVLTDSAGKTLYHAIQEKNGTIQCTGKCLQLWVPLTTTKTTVTAPAGLSGTLATVKRPDSGKLQVTYQGNPLYTFTLDTKSGDTNGNGAKDSFGGKSFHWQEANTGSSTPAPTSGGGGYNY